MAIGVQDEAALPRACVPLPSSEGLDRITPIGHDERVAPACRRWSRRIASLSSVPCGPPVRGSVVLHCHTMAEGLDWLPEDGVVLTRADLERIFIDLRALISGTDQLDPNRSFAVDIAVAITHAIERESGGQ